MALISSAAAQSTLLPAAPMEMDEDAAAAHRINTPPGSPCSVASDCSSVATVDFDAFAEAGSALVLDDLVAVTDTAQHHRVAAARSVFALDCVPRWGLYSVCGRRPEMEDAALVLPRFFQVPLWMVAGDAAVDGLDRASFRLPAHFFGVFDGHGGAQVSPFACLPPPASHSPPTHIRISYPTIFCVPQVANYCRERIHSVLIEELGRAEDAFRGTDLNGLEPKKQWERAFVDCFTRVDAEVGGNASQPVAPDTVGSTAVVAVLCSSHIIVANCGDSRAVLCRGKQPLALSADHKVS